MQYSVIGTANQAVVTQMHNGDEVRAEAAAMLLLSDGILVESPAHHTPYALAAAGAHVRLTHFRCTASVGVITFAARCVGEARQLEVREGTWLCARDAFLFCSQNVVATVGMAFAVTGGGFGIEGCVLYRLAGRGEAYVHCGGGAIEYDLVPGQRVSVDACCVVAFQDTVQAAMESVGGLTSSRGEPETLLLMTLTGPGKIFMAVLPSGRIRTVSM